ncbi:UNVERIFIED_CONTAM: hypothetical protein HDU68_001808 [Siphonaria sp. JEL0065]|nr:hypothetical protein HDU68_001808 [Siphonaria sp. JEL0065]
MSSEYKQLLQLLPSLLANIPSEWLGTTFANRELLGREAFGERVLALAKKQKKSVSQSDLLALGTCEDYFRVASNLSLLLELVLATKANLEFKNVFGFASETMPLVAVALATTSDKKVAVFGASSTHKNLKQHLALLNANVSFLDGNPTATNQQDSIVVVFKNAFESVPYADAVIVDSVLYILNPSKITADSVLVVRKRLSTPITTPVCLSILQKIAGVKVVSDTEACTKMELDSFLAHLQVMSGTKMDPGCWPVVFTAGLPAVCSLWWAVLGDQGGDILMASTAYGGSSQLTDIFASRSTPSSLFTKSTFDITGKNDIQVAIKLSLDGLAARKTKAPTTVVFVEIPTNPDMKVPDLKELATILKGYQESSGKSVLLVLDTTFAPCSGVLGKIAEIAPDLTTMVFISMSKSVSRGHTTAGAIVANSSSPKSRILLNKIRSISILLDTTAKKDQLWRLTQNHVGVESRCDKAYIVAYAVGEALVRAVGKHVKGYKMELAFVTTEQAANGFTTSTFSFNLPPLQNVSGDVNRGLAQTFVDLLTAHKRHFKPCVSFGQDNGLVYATVPATSTQGAIKEEDKAKQLVGGVELTRLSFAANVDVKAVVSVIEESVAAIYGGGAASKL